jgi:acyl dehydratase
MRTLYPKAIAGIGASALRRLPGLGGGSPELPDLELILPGVEVDREHVAAYDHVCGFTLRDELPATYPHILAFPLAMEIMTDGSFPYAVVGLVHIENRIEQLRPLRADEHLTVRVSTGQLEPHERGTQFRVLAEVEAGGGVAWRSRSTYLHREGGGGNDSGRKKERDQPPEPNAIWSVPGDIGRRYAGVSGDRNPIHLHPLTARLFGMPKPIAHGMWVKARCLAALEGELPESYMVDVRFKLPLFIPAKVAFSSTAEPGGRRVFGVNDAKSGKPHVSGTVKPGF